MAGMTELAPGAIFAGDYRIVHPLSRGGMGVVYVAEQLSTGANRALKLMRADLVPHESLLRLFKQEARIGHLIKSDHIVRVIDAGVDPESGSPWLAMELLEGEVLSARLLREALLPHKEAVEVLSQVCNALAAAHAAGIVHRDLKPENLFLADTQRDGFGWTVKVLDLGIAKLLADATIQGGRTATGTMAIGTPLWMAPEQATGELISAATDVWAIGLLAFRLLTGRCYWTTSESRDGHAILQELRHAPMVSASERASEYGCADRIPAAFDGWFARCVARNRVERFGDAGEARTGLRIAVDLQHTTKVSEVTPVIRPSQPPCPPIVPPQPPGAIYDPRWYVPRDREERAALNYLDFPGTPAVLFGPQRSGKTWLLHRCLAQIKKQRGYESIVINFRRLKHRSLDELVQRLYEQISEARDVPPQSLAAVSSRPGGEMGKLTRLMDNCVLEEVKTGLVLVLDDVDDVSGSPFQDDFFALLRSWAENPEEPWPRLRLMLAVSTTPALLINDPNRSPFNLTSPILLGELSVAQVEELARRYGVGWSASDIERVMALVGGHPYRIRLLMHASALHKTPLSSLLDPGHGAGWILANEVGRIRAWFGKTNLLDVTARIARDPGCALDADEMHRLSHAGVVVEETPGLRRLRHGLFVLAALGRA